MHSLWSRAAQAQSSCRCRICLHSGRSISRRSTTAASRRKVTAADLFTACYTTILGTATVIDVKRKEDRKRELDEKLEKARAALGSLGVQESSGQQGAASSRPDAGSANTSQSRSLAPRRKRPETSASSALLQELASLCEITRRPFPRPSWIQIQLEWAHIEAAVAAEERDPNYLLREPTTTQKLERTTITIVELVDQLIRRNQTLESTRRQDNEEIRGKRSGAGDTAWKELEDILQSSHYPSYYPPLMDPDDIADTRSLLGQSIRRIFNQAASSREIIAKICYNMLTSRAPPTIHTYNTLIAGFNRIQRPDLAQTVIDSYIHNTAWPATQQTIVCLLNHYRLANHKEGLRDIIGRMRGVRDTGLHFRIIDKNVIFSKGWMQWITENCASRKYAFVERARRGDDVFNSLIKAWLHCGEIGNACMVFVACMRHSGWVTAQTLQELLTACLGTVDYAAARRIIKAFVENTRRFAGLIHKIILEEPATTSRQVVMSLSHLLDICWLGFKNVSGPAAETYDRMLQEFSSFVNRTRLKLEIRETARVCTAAFEGINSTDFLLDRLDRAIATIDSAQRAGQKAAKTLANFSRVAKLISIDRTVRNLETKIKVTATLARAAILKSKTGYDLDPSSLIGSNQILSSYQQSRHDFLCDAIQSIQIHEGAMTQESIRLQLLQRLPDPALRRRFENSGNSENLPIRTLVTFYTSNPVTFNEAKNGSHDESIRYLEQQLTDTEDTLRAVLFVHLSGETQKKLRYRYADWYKMPLEQLVKHSMRIHIRGAAVATGVQQTYAVELRDQETPAIRTIKELSIAAEDVGEANNIAPKPATNYAAMKRRSYAGRRITKPHSASSFVEHDEDVPFPLALG